MILMKLTLVIAIFCSNLRLVICYPNRAVLNLSIITLMYYCLLYICIMTAVFCTGMEECVTLVCAVDNSIMLTFYFTKQP